MRKIIIAVLFLTAQLTWAGPSELDNEPGTLGNSAVNLPGTLVVRQNLKDKKISVLNVNQVLAADKTAAKKLKEAPFQEASIDSQLAGHGGNEKDAISSTPAWGFAFGLLGLGLLGGYALGRSSYYGGYYSSYTRGYTERYYIPTYYSGGANYSYAPYYGYRDGGYSYSYYGCPSCYAGYQGRGFWDYISQFGQ